MICIVFLLVSVRKSKSLTQRAQRKVENNPTVLLLSPFFSVSSVLKAFPLLQLSRERQQRDVARPLDRFAEPPLVARAGARHAARQDFSPLLHERLQLVHLLVIDEVHVIDAEAADFLLAKILALPAAAWSSGTAARSSRASALAARTASARVASFGTASSPSASSVAFRA